MVDARDDPREDGSHKADLMRGRPVLGRCEGGVAPWFFPVSHGRSGWNCRVSIGALDEPLNGSRPQLFLSPAADGESNVPGWPNDLFLVGGTDQVVQRLGLAPPAWACPSR